MKVIVNGTSITLAKNDFLASGGEGSVYVKGNNAYKIYKNKAKAMPKQKIVELSVLQHPSIVNPQHPVYDEAGDLIGYVMQYIPKGSTFVLCEMFPKPFKDRNALTSDKIISLVKKLRDQVQYCHDKNVLIVDMNELNFLVSNDFENIYHIDTDSYQTASYPATAIMDSIRDRHAKKYDIGTDWFSFGIITFELFTGAHPYKGKYSKDRNMPMDDMMINNLSLLNKDVSCPPFISSTFTSIPQVYMDWYKYVFETGQRIAPPIDMIQSIQAQVTMVKRSLSTGIIEDVWFSDTSVNVIKYLATGIILTDKHLLINKVKDTKVAPYSKVVFDPKTGSYISYVTSHGQVRAYNVSKSVSIPCQIQGYNTIAYAGRTYIVQENYISELKYAEYGSGPTVVSVVVANIIGRSTVSLEGCAVQNLLGTHYLSIFPESGKHFQIRLPELDDYRIVSGKFDKYVAMIIAEQGGKFNKFTFKFSKDYSKYACIKSDGDTVNFTCLPSGVVVSVNENYNLEVFTITLADLNVKVLKDTDFSNKTLDSVDNNVIYYENGDVVSIKMK